MIRVMIVDDEPIYRLALRELIRWEEHGCEIIAEASNGLDALRRVASDGIDLVIVDIQMPILSGLDFLKRLRETPDGQRTAVIVLSAYSQFEYVRQAFMYGVHDYMIKEDLNSEHVGEIIGRTAAKIGEANDIRERQQIESMAREERRKEETLLSLLDSDAEPGEAVEPPPEWLASVSSRQSYLCCLLIDSDSGDSSQMDSKRSRMVAHAVRQASGDYRLEATIARIDQREYALLLLFPSQLGELQTRKVASELAGGIISRIRDYLNLESTLGFSRPGGHPSDWPNGYRRARRLAEARFYLGSGRSYFEEDVAPYPRSMKGPAWDVPEIVRKLETGHPDWVRALEEGMNSLAGTCGAPVETTLQAYRSLVWEIGSLLYSKGLNWEELGERESPLERIGSFEHIRALNGWISSLLRAVCDAIDPKKRILEASPPLVGKVKMWIERHYQEPISLSSASQAAGISESYLSKIFAKETGVTFIEYVMRTRVEKAILFMGSGMKIYEIAEKVGYPNQGHFSKIFKKVTGKTPLEYREEMFSK